MFEAEDMPDPPSWWNEAFERLTIGRYVMIGPVPYVGSRFTEDGVTDIDGVDVGVLIGHSPGDDVDEVRNDLFVLCPHLAAMLAISVARRLSPELIEMVAEQLDEVMAEYRARQVDGGDEPKIPPSPEVLRYEKHEQGRDK
jgi:hypothetical protein